MALLEAISVTGTGFITMKEDVIISKHSAEEDFLAIDKDILDGHFSIYSSTKIDDGEYGSQTEPQPKRSDFKVTMTQILKQTGSCVNTWKQEYRLP